MKKLLILNGPNLNLLGHREQAIYGSTTFEEYLTELQKHFAQYVTIDYAQSNVEGELINILHSAVGQYQGVILNAGGYTHTSVALADGVGGVASMGLPTVEVHISNIMAREDFRHVSYLSPRCVGSIWGFGLESYRLAIEYYISKINEED
ncbi:MAG: type II 3-dehydroquinate dehydratase [Mucinivorans sp.]